MPFKTIATQKKEIGKILVCFPFITVLTDNNTTLIVECDSNTVADVLTVYLSSKGYKTRDGSRNGQFYIDLVEPVITIDELVQKMHDLVANASRTDEDSRLVSTYDITQEVMSDFANLLGVEWPQ
jgi:hypothetical protein